MASVKSSEKSLAYHLRRAGQRDIHANFVLNAALDQMPKVLNIMSVEDVIRDDVVSSVLMAVWEYWIDHAKKRLIKGEWSDADVQRKLVRTLCYWTFRRTFNVRDMGSRRQSRELVWFSNQSKAGENGHARFELSSDEWQFIQLLASSMKDRIGREPQMRVLQAVRTVAAVYRTFGGSLLGYGKGKWIGLFNQVLDSLEDVK